MENRFKGGKSRKRSQVVKMTVIQKIDEGGPNRVETNEKWKEVEDFKVYFESRTHKIC